MKRAHSILLVAALALTGCAEGYRYGVSVDVTNAPPPPRLVFYERPAYIASLSGGVYVVDPGSNDCDMFRYGSYWYVYTGSYWYRARDYSGPYAVITVESVPSRVMNVPDRHWRKGHPHGEPPGQRKKRNRDWSS
ncbi:MAG TPA: hypothetical protein VFU59_08405 [Candidatus Eisenbacteria bacterium]|nr:hypothetical protein [Candidatus Eisenbacteria bacterium]